MGEFLEGVIGEACPPPIPDAEGVGTGLFKEGVEKWAGELSLSAAGLCLGAILEAVGNGEAAVRILDRLVRKETEHERDTADRRALQLHYGRLGAAWGRFVGTLDLGGNPSNASVESTQSLLRIRASELDYAAHTWLACAFLWRSMGAEATACAVRVITDEARTDEEAVDGWIAAAQVFVVNGSSKSARAMLAMVNDTLARADRCGDVVRKARAAALAGLVLAESRAETPEFLAAQDFSEAERVGDGFALGMRALAQGRWRVSSGRTRLVETDGHEAAACQALEYFQQAIEVFRNQGMHPWIAYSQLQTAKAYAYLNDFGKANELLELANETVDRFIVFDSHYLETRALIEFMDQKPERGAEYLQGAIEAAQNSGLDQRAEHLMSYFDG